MYKYSFKLFENEIFKPILNFEKYHISNYGRIASFNWTKHPKYGKLLSLRKNKYGYFQVTLHNEGLTCFAVHKLVLEAFKEIKPDGYQARHLNNIRTDNFVENLEWGTPLENGYDLSLSGNLKGENNPQSKLTNVQVKEIRECLNLGIKASHLARKFHVSDSLISQIKLKQRWQHIL